MNDLSLRRIPLGDVDWPALDGFSDRVLFQRKAWLTYLCEMHGAAPVVAEVRDGDRTCGWFTGLVTKHAGLRVLGSPRPGWTTPYLGFNLLPGLSRRDALTALVPFAYRELGCVQVELCDRWCTPDDYPGLGGRGSSTTTFVVDLRPELDEISARMTSGTRQNLRKGRRCGLVVEDAPPEGFAEEYYAQLRDVFAKQGLQPSYPLRRVQCLIEHLHPTGDLQLLRVRAPEGTSIATGIIVGAGRSAYFWGGASWREHQHLRPNEALFWHAFTTWRDRGAEEFDFGGGGAYKQKYGPVEVTVPHFRWSRWPGLEAMRGVAKAGSRVRQRVPVLTSARHQTGVTTRSSASSPPSGGLS